jgi:hypothetical protein
MILRCQRALTQELIQRHGASLQGGTHPGPFSRAVWQADRFDIGKNQRL